MRALAAALALLLAATPALAQRPSFEQRTDADDAPRPYVTVQNAPWAKDAVIYQINTHQVPKKGSFPAAHGRQALTTNRTPSCAVGTTGVA
jgi:hypothetical protein